MRGWLLVFVFVVGGVWLAKDIDQSPSKELTSCLASTEQTILLRQLALTDKARESFDFCRNDGAFSASFCSGLYLNSNRVVRECMNKAGYEFIDSDLYLSHNENLWKSDGVAKDGICSWQQYEDPNCYRRTWWFNAINGWLF
jgi:hypothetical protein